MERERRDAGGLGAVGLIVTLVMAAGLIAGRDGAVVGGVLAVLGALVRSGIDLDRDAAPPTLEAELAPLRPEARAPLAAPVAFAAAVPPIDVAARAPAAGIPVTPRLPFRLGIDWRAIEIDAGLLTKLTACVVSVFFAWFFLSDLGDNPAGLFADEAEIGIRARELLTKQLLAGRNPFFYQHFNYSHQGTLSLFVTAPFVLLLGLSDFSVRLASVAPAAAAVVVLVLFVRRIGWRYGEVGVLAFAASPVYIHFARLNFGQSASVLCVAIGLYCYARGRMDGRLRWFVLAGAAIAASAYGNPGYYLSAPAILAALSVGEVAVTWAAWRRYRGLVVSLATAGIAWLPVLWEWERNPRFRVRFEEKSGTDAGLFSLDRLRVALDHYGRYLGLDYLFVKGESGLPGAFVLRHSVLGAGELLLLTLPLMALGVVAVWRVQAELTRLFGVFGIAMLLLYPFPDALASTQLATPYTVTAFGGMLFVPVLSALGVAWAVAWLRGREIGAVLRPRVTAGLLLGLVLLGGSRFFTGPYADYPKVSAGYYGWQFGPRQAIDVFAAHRDEYDRYQLDGDFNEAFVFLDFYLDDDPELRAKSMIGGLVLMDLRKRELLAVRAEKYDALVQSTDPMRAYLRVVDVIRYPDGSAAMYVLDSRLENATGRLERPS